MARILLTAFEPFGQHRINASQQVLRALSQAPPAGLDLAYLEVPVVAQSCVERVWQCVESQRPDWIVAMGQADTSALIRLEDRACNLDHFCQPDNDGNQRQAQPILQGGPAVYRTSLDLGRIVSELRREGHPLEWSFSAGSYVCNHLYYHLLHRSAEQAGPSVLFIHLPLLPEQLRNKQRRQAQALDLCTQLRSVQAILRRCPAERG